MIIQFLDYAFLLLDHTIVFLGTILFLLLAVAYYTLLERKVMASMQRRQGPAVVGGSLGLLQPIADGLKLFLKRPMEPRDSFLRIFLFAPVFTLAISFCSWLVIPFSLHHVVVDLNYGLLLLFVLSSLGVHGVILAGWSSNSRYAFMGGVRSTAQMISYEVAIGFIFVTVAASSSSYNLIDIVFSQKTIWFVYPYWPLFVIFLIAMAAETNRAPFDLPEAEAELVAGYNVEYGAMAFAMFFLAEYSNMLIMSFLVVIMFFGGWLPFTYTYLSFVKSPLALIIIKVLFFAFFLIWIRAAFPRYRYDQLMFIGWMTLLPVTFFAALFYITVLYVYGGTFEGPDLLHFADTPIPLLVTQLNYYDFFFIWESDFDIFETKFEEDYEDFRELMFWSTCFHEGSDDIDLSTLSLDDEGPDWPDNIITDKDSLANFYSSNTFSRTPWFIKRIFF